MQTIASTTLGLKSQALAVLAMLAQQEPDFAPYDEKQHEYDYDCTTSAWYNGRENGISLVVRPRFRKVEKSLVITFSEVRNSDDIFINSWEDSSVYFLNPPTISDWPETAYKSRKTVRYGRVISPWKSSGRRSRSSTRASPPRTLSWRPSPARPSTWTMTSPSPSRCLPAAAVPSQPNGAPR